MLDGNEGSIARLLIQRYHNSKELPDKNELKEVAEKVYIALGFDCDIDILKIINHVDLEIRNKLNAGQALVNTSARHDENWVYKTNNSGRYAEAYAEYLINKNWNPAIVNTMMNSDATKILGLLQDPTSEGSWNRRGLVIGHVQSGKTANYLGVITKAADAGYKFIIVIAGIHNNLRRQTQERIDEGFIGRSSDPNHRVNIGVGLNHDYQHPATLTNIHDDFNAQTAAKMGWQLNDFSKPIILVIKKNVNTLNALYLWLRSMNVQGNGRIYDVPMLMIDDEADNASINTNKEDIAPTKTNALIRSILGLFSKSCYVGYTATPFANIFINPDAFGDEEVREELFPKDFIYSLDAPSNYFGPDYVFLNENNSSKVLREIDDCESHIPFSHKKDSNIDKLPPSLHKALNVFIVARAIRNLRGQAHSHCSMLINVSRFVEIQRTVKSLIDLEVSRIKNAVKSNYMMPETISDKNYYMKSLKDAFVVEYADLGITWNNIKLELNNVFENFRTFLVNSKSDDVLDFSAYDRNNESLTAITIGGLSLSRGLTIEGLTVSYMYRNTKMYDTLMQMGRWFGYRPRFEDVCRVYLSADSIDWYTHIALASEELRQQISLMRQSGLSPRDFGLYVQSHPDRLMITAANKMKTGTKFVINQNLTRRLVESTVLPVDQEVNRINEELISTYWKNKFDGIATRTQKGYFISDVSTNIIEDFLLSFRTEGKTVTDKEIVVKYLRAINDKFPKSDVLLISVGKDDLSDYVLGVQKRACKNIEKGLWKLSKNRLASRGDEKLGLTDKQLNEACLLANTESNSLPLNDAYYRDVRNKPLLMLHVLEPKDNDDLKGARIPGWGVSFPSKLYDVAVELQVVANQVFYEQMFGSTDHVDDDEDDFEF